MKLPATFCVIALSIGSAHAQAPRGAGVQTSMTNPVTDRYASNVSWSTVVDLPPQYRIPGGSDATPTTKRYRARLAAVRQQEYDSRLAAFGRQIEARREAAGGTLSTSDKRELHRVYLRDVAIR